jgi:ribonuclease P protein subunit RPR2
MGKGKAQGTSAGISQKHLHSRISYLYQASTFLSSKRVQNPDVQTKSEGGYPEHFDKCHQSGKHSLSKSENLLDAHDAVVSGLHSVPETESIKIPNTPMAVLSRALLSQMRAVSLKSQTRLSPNIKRSTCKRCDTLLTPGISSSVTVHNGSIRKHKSTADVLVIQCLVCNAQKRIPVGVQRQSKRKNGNLPQV